MTLSALLRNAAYAVRVVVTERRLPGRLGNAPVWVALPYVAARLAGAGCRRVEPRVVIEGADHIGGRYLYALAHGLSLWLGPVQIERPPSLASYSRLGHEGRLLFRHPAIRVGAPGANRPVSARRVIVCRSHAEADSALCAHPPPTLIACTDLSQPALPGSLLLPFSVYPALLQRLDAVALDTLRASVPSVRVFFAGKLYGTTRDKHDDDLIPLFYHMPSRQQALNVMFERLDAEQFKLVERAAERDALFNPTTQYEPRVVASGVKGSLERWLEEIARADFFLALPGSHMPMCHNVIEALAVGSVPILSYAHWFAPALRDGVDCLLYDSEESLIVALKHALSMSPDKVREMRKQAARYYDAHLAPNRVAEYCQSLGDSLRILYFNTEDADNYRDVSPDAVLTRGGTLQRS